MSYTVTTTSDGQGGVGTLSWAINQANAAGSASTINFAPGTTTYTLTGPLPEINANVTIEGTTGGGGVAIDAAGHQGLFVNSGIVSLENLTIENATVVGASGANGVRSPETGGGGGGPGLGGGLFINQASVTLSNVDFQNDRATGGAGGAAATPTIVVQLQAKSGGAGGGSGGVAGHAPIISGRSINGGPGGTGGFGGGGGGGGGGAGGLGKGLGAVGAAGGFGGGHGGNGTNNGGQGGGGGGGLGAGGDIFIAPGGSLTIDGGSLAQGTVNGGVGGASTFSGTNGAADGAGIFIEGTPTVTFGTGQTAGQITTIAGDIASTGSGSVTIAGDGTVVLGGNNSYTGGTTIQSGTLDLAGAHAAGTGAITFDPGTLEFSAANAPTNEIDGFGTGDFIQIDGFVEQSGTYFNNTLTLHGTNGSGGIETVALDMPGLSPSDFSVLVGANTTTIGFGSGETDIVACYTLGTQIAAEHGEIPVETLAIGDQVVTASGALRPIKWIGRRSYGGRFIMGRKDILPICFKAGSLGANMPRRDLWISPHHAMYFAEHGGVLIEAKDLVNGSSIVQAQSVDKVEYFHIELDTHDVIIAEGALSESFIDDGSRGIFHNAHEYPLLYPDAMPDQLARYCAPRLEDGHEVEAARRSIALRAGLRSAGQSQVGALRGFVDVVRPDRISGWAQNVDHPEAPVCLDVYAGTERIGQVLANHFRDDLKHKGLGSGAHGFSFTVPPNIRVLPHAVEVRRSLDGAPLKRTAKAGGRSELPSRISA